MEIKPDVKQFMKLEVYIYATISLVTILAVLIIQILVVNLDPEVENAEFVQNVWSWVIAALTLLWILGPWLSYLWITNLKYSILDERVVIHKGILTKKSVSIPYAAITDFTLKRSLYERWLNIGTLLIQTAGQGVQAGGYEGQLVGLVHFEDLHRELQSRVRSFKGGNPQSQPADPGGNEADVLQAILQEIRKINSKMN